MPKLTMSESFAVVPQRHESRQAVPSVARTVSMSPDTSPGATVAIARGHRQSKQQLLWHPRPAFDHMQKHQQHQQQTMLRHHDRVQQDQQLLHVQQRQRQRQRRHGALQVAPNAPNSPTAISESSINCNARPSPTRSNRHVLTAKSKSRASAVTANQSAFDPPVRSKTPASATNAASSATSAATRPTELEVRCRELQIELKRHEIGRKCLQWRVLRLENVVKSLKAESQQHHQQIKTPISSKSEGSGSVTPVRTNKTRKVAYEKEESPQQRKEDQIEHQRQPPAHLFLPQLRPAHLHPHYFHPHPHHPSYYPPYAYPFYGPPPHHAYPQHHAPWQVPQRTSISSSNDDQNGIPYCIRFYSCYNGTNCLPADEDLSDNEDDECEFDDDCDEEVARIGVKRDADTAEAEAALAMAALSNPPAVKRRRV